MDKLQKSENIQRQQQQQHFNAKHRAKLLPPLSAAVEVQIANYDETGVVRGKTNSPRQYVVQTPTSTLRRNRVHLVPLPDSNQSESSQVSEDRKEGNPEPRTVAQLRSPLNILSKPRRTIKPSLKVRENMANNCRYHCFPLKREVVVLCSLSNDTRS